ncbi:MAG: aminotransferase class I/II-fold pyridoxal phosphate-dependent enzyme [Bacteroidota bacterium]
MNIPAANRLNQVEEYYFSTKLREIRRRVQEGQDIINLGIGSPDLSPAEDVLNTLVESALQPANHAYQPYKGIPELRESFANWYGKSFGVHLAPDSELLPLMGSKEGIMHISFAFLNPGDSVLVPDPGYPTYTSVARLLGAKIRHYPLCEENGWLPNLAQLETEGLAGVKMMWVNYPHMPTGTAANPELFDELIAFAQRHKILLVNDNPYSLVLNPSPMSILARYGAKGVALELNSLSKSHNMAGWRVGMVAGHSEYIDKVLRVKSNMDSGMFLPVQLAASKALLLEDSWHQARNDIYQARRKVARQILKNLGCTYQEDQVGMFLWARIPENTPSSAEFSDQILDSLSIFLTPGFIFGQQGEGYIRLSLCSKLERLREARDRIGKSLFA